MLNTYSLHTPLTTAQEEDIDNHMHDFQQRTSRSLLGLKDNDNDEGDDLNMGMGMMSTKSEFTVSTDGGGAEGEGEDQFRDDPSISRLVCLHVL